MKEWLVRLFESLGELQSIETGKHPLSNFGRSIGEKS